MDQSRFIRGLLDDPADPQQPQYVPANDFGPRAYGLLNSLFPDPNVMVGDAIRQYRGGDPIGAFETMFGAIPATGALKAAPKAPGIIAYHGSPHSFDKFDLSKIGTGEGAQAYGHGLYFADSEDVARSYRDNLAVKNDPREGINNILDNVGFGVQRGDVEAHAAGLGLPNLSGAQLDDIYAALKGRNSDGTISDSGLDALRRLDRTLPPAGKGSMYQVRINADPNAFLDWDRPLSEQSPIVQKTITTLAKTAPEPKKGPSIRNRQAILNNDGSVPGDILYNNIGGHNFPAETSSALREAGIPGIKYLDQGSRPNVGHVDMLRQQLATLKSRSASQAAIDNTQRALDEAEKSISRNYVVFDDSLIDILKKYGLIGLLGGGAAASGVSGMNTPPAMPNNAPGL